MTSVPLSLRIDSEIKKQIEQEAEALDRSSSYVVVQAITSYLNAKKNERKAIEEALIEAEKGEFISQEAMREWFASLGTDKVLPRPKPDVFLKKNT